jgi:hypothetical protein
VSAYSKASSSKNFCRKSRSCAHQTPMAANLFNISSAQMLSGGRLIPIGSISWYTYAPKTYVICAHACEHASAIHFSSFTYALTPPTCLPIRLSIRSPVGWQTKAKSPASSAHFSASRQRFPPEDVRQFPSISRVPSCTSDPYETSEFAASADASSDSDCVSDDDQVYPVIDTEQVCSHPHISAPDEVAQHILAVFPHLDALQARIAGGRSSLKDTDCAHVCRRQAVPYLYPYFHYYQYQICP